MEPGRSGARRLAGAVLCLVALSVVLFRQAGADPAQVDLAPSGVPAPALTALPGATVSYRQGWNIVAGPSGMTFPQANPILYTSQGAGYSILPNTSSITQGWGYWAYFASDTAVLMNGIWGNSYAATLEPGQFKMVGNPSGGMKAVAKAEVIWTYDPASVYTRNQGSAVLDVGRGAWAYSSSGGTVTVAVTDAPVTTPAASPTPTPAVPVTPSATGTPMPPATPAPTRTAIPTPTATPTATRTAVAVPESIRFAGTNSVGRDLNFDIKGDLSAVTRFLSWYEVHCPETYGFGWEEYRWPAHLAIVDGRFRIEVPAGGGRTDIYAGEFDATFTTAKGAWLKWLVITYPTFSDALCSNSGTWTASRQP